MTTNPINSDMNDTLLHVNHANLMEFIEVNDFIFDCDEEGYFEICRPDEGNSLISHTVLRGNILDFD